LAIIYIFHTWQAVSHTKKLTSSLKQTCNEMQIVLSVWWLFLAIEHASVLDYALIQKMIESLFHQVSSILTGHRSFQSCKFK